MNKDSHFTGQLVYSQVLKLLDKEKILQISRETKGSEAYVKRFDGFQHLVVMLFGILKRFDSLRELKIGMKAEAHKLGHLGMNYLVRRSTLAETNIRRPQEFFEVLPDSNNLPTNIHHLGVMSYYPFYPILSLYLSTVGTVSKKGIYKSSGRR